MGAAADTLALLDGAVAGRALVYGSLPPAARDLDVLVRDADAPALERALRDAGFTGRGGVWARFAAGGATAVDLSPASEWGLPAPEVDALFDEAILLDGCEHVARPAPQHVVLLLGRRGSLGEKQRARLAAALAEDPDAETKARARAAAWGEPARRSPRAAARRAFRVVSGSNVVCLSGLDGAGKSSQGAALQEALRAVGIDAATEWLPFGQNPAIERASELARVLLRLLRRVGPAKELERHTASGGSLFATPGDTPERGALGRLALFAWTTTIALANALHQRRTAAQHALHGRVVIFDRYSLDSIVRLRYLYGDAERFPFQSWLIRAVSPRPRCAFLLDVAPETALARKQDQWSLDDLRRQAELYRDEARRQGVTRLDGERPRDELHAEIADAVWKALA
jgi:thymidylate kinase